MELKNSSAGLFLCDLSLLSLDSTGFGQTVEVTRKNKTGRQHGVFGSTVYLGIYFSSCVNSFSKGTCKQSSFKVARPLRP